MDRFAHAGIEVVPVDTFEEALELLYARAGLEKAAALPKPAATLAAQGAKERTQGVALH